MNGAFVSLKGGDTLSNTVGGDFWRGKPDTDGPQWEYQDSEEGCFDSSSGAQKFAENTPSCDEEFMDEDFESYSIPDNFDDFQEDPPLRKPASDGTPSSSISLAPAVHLAKLTNFEHSFAKTPSTNVTTSTTQSALSGTTTRGPLLATANARNVLPLKPASSGSSSGGGGGGCKDDSSEFRGPYKHTKEMFKVFTQVQSVYSEGTHCRCD